jgi:ssDNA-binding Zn-finger/Zn-ribbon topoisomerase 1
MPDLSQIDFKICIPLGIVILLFILIAFGRPKETVWIEHCPHCNAELGPKPKGERPGKCKKCGRDLYFTKPHGTK